MLQAINSAKKNLEKEHLILGKCYDLLAFYFWHPNLNPDSTLKYRLMALPIFEQHLEEEDLQLGELKMRIGFSYEFKRIYDKALPFIQSAFEILPDSCSGCDLRRLNLLNSLGIINYEFGDLESAEKWLLEQLAYARKLGKVYPKRMDRFRRFVVNFSLGRLYMRMGDYDRALSYYYDTSPGSGRYYSHIGHIYEIKGEIELAKTFYLNGLKVAL